MTKNQVRIGKRISPPSSKVTRKWRATAEKSKSCLLRKVAKKIAEIDDPKELEQFLPVTISPEDLKEYLGPETYTREMYEGNKQAGVVTGLAWTRIGGEILTIESAIQSIEVGKDVHHR